MFFAGGVLIGGFIAATLLTFNEPISIDENLRSELSAYGITHIDTLIPTDLFNAANLLTWRGFITMVFGGFLVGFGTRYAGGCTSGHSIFGISNLQLPSLIATLCFMAGGFFMANFILPVILTW